MTEPSHTELLLGEMFSPTIASGMRELGHDVVAVVERADLRAMADEEIFSWASPRNCWLLTENVKDFRPLQRAALQAGSPAAGIVFTSSRSFPRSRKNPGPLISAIDAWLRAGPPEAPLTEDWLPAGR